MALYWENKNRNPILGPCKLLTHLAPNQTWPIYKGAQGNNLTYYPFAYIQYVKFQIRIIYTQLWIIVYNLLKQINL